MTRRVAALALSLAALTAAGSCTTGQVGSSAATPGRPPVLLTPAEQLRTDLDRIFDVPALERALMAVRVESLRSGEVIYAANADKLVVPASNMKIITVAAAASRLGWDYTYETTLDAVGRITGGALEGDLVVTGTGDPSIGSPDGGHPALFLEWAEALVKNGISRVDGRIVGDDNAFEDEPFGAGWAWDYLAAGYAAPSGALSYNENVAVVRVSPAAVAGASATIAVAPEGHLLSVTNQVVTVGTGPLTLELLRLPGDTELVVRGRMPVGAPTAIRTATVDNPTLFFAEALRVALASRGIIVRDRAVDIDEIEQPAGRRVRIATRRSASLSSLVGYAMKVSQNFYGEMLLKTLGRRSGTPGSIEGGRAAIRELLQEWGIPANTVVPYDGSGLSRYNFTTTGTIVTVLKHVWKDERLRGPYVASLPVGGSDGTLETRMKSAELNRRVQAKTGTINNVRALSGYLETRSGEKLVFSMIANNYTSANAEIDVAMEAALARLAH